MIVRYGIDPGKKVAGWACTFDDRLVACGLTGDPHNWIPSFRPIGGVHECIVEHMRERPYDERCNANDLIDVAFSGGRMSRAVMADKTTQKTPMQWKRSVPKEIMGGWILGVLEKSPEELEIFRAAEQIVLAEFKRGASLIHNILDAIGILFVETGRLVL